MITLVPIGDVEESVLRSLAPPLAEILGQQAEVAVALILPQGGWSRSRRQYLASALLVLVSRSGTGEPGSGDHCRRISTRRA